MVTRFVRFYFRLIAGITLSFGLALLLFPAFASGLFFEKTGSESLFFLRICGSTLIGYAALNWLATQSKDATVYKVAAWSNLVTLVIATIVSILAYSEFDHNSLLLTAQHAVFACGFAYCLIRLK